MAHWTLDDIPWDRFDASAVDADILALIKAAAMVEHNGGDYAIYLCNVFDGDAAFCEAARHWAAEEVQHGVALARWARLADPDFDFAAAFKRFTDGYKLPLDAAVSVRGSRTGELIARCIVEVGTSSYYSALRDATDEPVLKAICQRIACDEFHHYKLFLGHMRRYQAVERLGLIARARVAFGRLAESEDDELAMAYHCGTGAAEPYSRKASIRAYQRRALPLYRLEHLRRGLAMALKAIGLDPGGWLGRGLARIAWWLMRHRARRLAAA